MPGPRPITAFFMVVPLLFIPSPLAAAPSTDVLAIAVDPRGDTVLTTTTGNQTAPPGYEDVDLAAVWAANESVETFDLGVEVFESENPLRLGFYAESLRIVFMVGNQEYRVGFSYAPCGRDNATLDVWNRGSGTHRNLSCLDASIDEARRTLTAKVPKAQILDAQGLPARPGTELSNLHAILRQTILDDAMGLEPGGRNVDVFVGDRVPDSGFAETFSLQIGNGTSTTLQLTSPNPVRFSNGESTTMVFEVRVENLGSADELVYLELRDLEPTWAGRVPARVQVEAGGFATLPVILTTEFTHRHGETGTFQVVAKTSSATAEATLPLGIEWADVPQPAGHHDTLYLHSKETSTNGALDPIVDLFNPGSAFWTNTLGDDPDPNATDAPAKSNYYSQRQTAGGVEFYQGWSFPLDPPLLMGLDFDHERTGVAQLAFRSGLGDVTTTINVQLLYCDPANPEGRDPGFASCLRGSWFPIAAGTSGPLSPGPQTLITQNVELKPDTGRDVIPYVPESNLRLHIEYLHNQAALGLDALAPTLLLTDSSVLIPLSEYHDPVDQAFDAVGTLRLEAHSPFEKMANAGRRAVFRFVVVNEAQTEQTVALSIEGHHVAWATLETTEASLPPSASREFNVVIDVPVDASIAERAELFVVAENVEDPATVAIARLRTTVVEFDVPDEDPADEEDLAVRTPSIPATLFLLAVGALAWTTRPTS